MAKDWPGAFVRAVIEVAEEKLGRSLNDTERLAIWNIKSMLMLEVWSDDLDATRSPDEAEMWMGKIVKTYLPTPQSPLN